MKLATVRIVKHRFLRVAAVGFSGFVVDVTCYTLALTRLNPYAARVVAFMCAIVFTWVANRTFTFKRALHRRLHNEFAHYLAASLISGICNVGVYSVLVAMLGRGVPALYSALVIGIVCALVLNYQFYNRWVFEPGPL